MAGVAQAIPTAAQVVRMLSVSAPARRLLVQLLCLLPPSKSLSMGPAAALRDKHAWVAHSARVAQNTGFAGAESSTVPAHVNQRSEHVALLPQIGQLPRQTFVPLPLRL